MLIALMAITAILSIVSVVQVGNRLTDLTQSYIPAYGEVARAEIRSIERALALRRIIIDKARSPLAAARIAAHRETFDAKGVAVQQNVDAANALLWRLIKKSIVLGDATSLTAIQGRIDTAINDTNRHLDDEIARLLPALDNGDNRAIDDYLVRIDTLRDELDQQLESVQSNMLAMLQSDGNMTAIKQRQSIAIAVALTVLAALLGLVFSVLVSAGVTRPVQRLLEGTRSVEAGRLDETLVVTTQDEIGHLTDAFNRMIVQLRLKESIRETFGRYIDPRVVEGLIDRPALAAEGERRIMTILFCDIKGFTGISEGVTPQGLVKLVNRYLSTISRPIREHEGVIDKYIGDAVMAFWGAPFTEDSAQARLASEAALDILELIEPLQSELPALLGLRSLPAEFDLRIGVATGEVLVGSIGCELMMNYTVMGDTVNLASRLEGANKVYGCRILVSEPTVVGAGDAIEAREIDKIVVRGQSRPHAVFEIMGRKGALTEAQYKLRDRFSEGLAAYRARRWDESRGAFEAALLLAPDDGPSRAFIARLEHLVMNPPDESWDACWRLDQK